MFFKNQSEEIKRLKHELINARQINEMHRRLNGQLRKENDELIVKLEGQKILAFNRKPTPWDMCPKSIDGE